MKASATQLFAAVVLVLLSTLPAYGRRGLLGSKGSCRKLKATCSLYAQGNASDPQGCCNGYTCTMPVKCTNYPGSELCRPKCKRPDPSTAMHPITFGEGGWPGYETSGDQEQPAIIVLQEWWGVTDEIKETAMHIAEQEYRVMIPDLYLGKVALDRAEALHLSSLLNWTIAQQQLAEAVDYLEQTGATKIGVVGFCMGGGLALCAAQRAGVAAAASFYGLPSYARCQVDQIQVPVQLHFGDLDSAFPPMVLNATVANLTAGNVDYELFTYAGAGHAFMNALTPHARAMLVRNNGIVPSEETVVAAFERMAAFFAQNLKGKKMADGGGSDGR